MNAKEILSKSKPIIIIILLFSIAFFVRAQTAHLPGVSDDLKPYFEDQNGLPYYSEVDSYYNYRMTQDYLDHGYLGDTIQNNTQWDLHSNYPPGRSATYPPLIVYVTAFAYKFLNLFTNIPLVLICFWMGAFIGSLAVIPAYLFIRRLTNDFGGITAGILVGLAPFYFQHTIAGFFDTDMFNMILPIFIVWFFVESIRAKDIKKRSVFVLLSAISVLIFSMAWEGWWYMFYLVIAATVTYLLVSNYLFEIETIKPMKNYSSRKDWFLDQPVIFPLVIFAILSSVLVSIHLGFPGFISSLIEPLGFTSIKSTVQSATSYPNVYLTVRELTPPSYIEVIYTSVGIIAFVLGILCIPLFIWRIMTNNTEKKDIKKVKEAKVKKRENVPKWKRKKVKTKKAKKTKPKTVKNTLIFDETKKNYLLYAILFSIWLIITAYSTTKGSRFIEGFSLPIALGAGIFIGLSIPYFKKYIKVSKYYSIVVLIVIAVIAYQPISMDYAALSGIHSDVNDDLYNATVWIKNNTPKNTVITSWWDFGHLFTLVADRPVTFDGGSQNTPRAYWVSKALVTSDENLSAGILRMLATSGDQGYSTLDNYTKDTGKTVEILNKILGVDKQTALSILTKDYNLSPQDAQNVLKYTHPDNPSPQVLVTSPDMASKSGVWSNFGNWNFQSNSGQAYGYDMGVGTAKSVNGTTVVQAGNVVAQINGTKVIAGYAYQNANKETQVIMPHKLIVIQDNEIVLNQVASNESNLSIILIKEGDTYIGVAMNRELENSMFTRLYFMRGADLKHFKLVYGQLPGTMVWNVS